MAKRRDSDKHKLEYLYRRLKHLEDAIKSIEALARMTGENHAAPKERTPVRSEGNEEPT